ncbi:M14 family metallopeptidase [Portibacter marinus]|uniref:M14 family metallopeptidase n=1 Tax=Portibacter marinus TaxID=2898660 RepID=UPI001F1C7B6B|nr:M14 family metallopeptidase [Portibacter marinus]
MRLLLLFFIFALAACSSGKLINYDFPNPIDTSTKPIEVQEKSSWTIDGVTVSNDFEGARMNQFSQDNDSTFRVLILPENRPINSSPWYAFTMSSEEPRTVHLVMDYGENQHRYWPKLSSDLIKWTPIDSSAADFQDGRAVFTVDLTTQPIYFSGQELSNSEIVKAWFDQVCENTALEQFEVGKSKLGRSLFGAVSEPLDEKAETVVFISRQHPPEVTGYKALQSYLDEVMGNSTLATDFRKKYRILVYPLLNPDGVDMGHWRHNAGGIDLNRDWQYYRQPETKQIAQHIVEYVSDRRSDVILGIDFHSTQEDVYYTYPDEHEHLMDFRNYWVEAIEERLGEGNAYEDPDPLESPVSKGWFIVQFGAEAVTYEVGDETPRDFIDRKARVSAQEMMKLLIMR